MATSADYIAAAGDQHLRARLTAILAASGHPNPGAVVTSRMGQLVAVQIAGGSTIADVYAYAVATYEPTPLPGVNPAAVTDTQLIEALRAIGALDEG